MTETYYQQTFILSCQSLLCDLTLPKFATGQRLILRNISCIMNSAGRAVYGKLDFKYQGSLSVQQFFSPHPRRWNF